MAFNISDYLRNVLAGGRPGAISGFGPRAPSLGGREPFTLTSGRRERGGPESLSLGTELFRDDPGLANVIDIIIREQRKDEERRQNQLAQISGQLGQVGSQIGDIFGARKESIEQNLPREPFTEELFQTRRDEAINQVAREVGSALSSAEVNLINRGFGRGSIGGQVGGGITGAGITARAESNIALREQQRSANEAASRFIESLLGDLETKQASLQSQIANAQAIIQAGGAIDPNITSNILQQAFAVQTAKEERDKFFNLINSIIEQENQPLNRLRDILPTLATIAFPGAQNIQGALGAFSALGRPNVPFLS